MADKLVALTAADISKWNSLLAADDWTWFTWKHFLGDTALILLWLAFMLTFVSLIIPSTRKKLSRAAKINVSGSTIFSGFIFTWLAGTFGFAALFGTGPYGYWLYQLLGSNTFADISDWTFRYMTLLGLLFG